MCDTPRPATGLTPVRNIRVADHLWRTAQDKARREGRSLTEVITAYLRRYVAAPDRTKPHQ